MVVVAGKYEAVDVEDKELPPGRDVSQHCMLTCQSLLLLRVYSVTVIMPRCACASEVYGSVVCVCVCVCVCACVCVRVDCYSCSRINEVQVRAFIGF